MTFVLRSRLFLDDFYFFSTTLRNQFPHFLTHMNSVGVTWLTLRKRTGKGSLQTRLWPYFVAPSRVALPLPLRPRRVCAWVSSSSISALSFFLHTWSSTVAPPSKSQLGKGAVRDPCCSSAPTRNNVKLRRSVILNIHIYTCVCSPAA